MEELDLGVYDEWKYIWQKRAVIFRRWSLSEVFDLGNSQNLRQQHRERVILDGGSQCAAG